MAAAGPDKRAIWSALDGTASNPTQSHRASMKLSTFAAVALFTVPAAAYPVTDTFIFVNPGPNGGDYSSFPSPSYAYTRGSFTFNTANPSVVNTLTIYAQALSYNSTETVPSKPLVLPTFDGMELVGDFTIFYDQQSNLITEAYGSFGPGATGIINTTNDAFDGPSFLTTDSGSIAYTLTAVPEPTGLALFASALLMGAWLRGRRGTNR